MGDRLGEAIALVNVGSLRLGFGDAEGARDALLAAAAIAETIGARLPLGFAQHNLGLLFAQTGEAGEASRWFDAALATRRAAGYRPGIAATTCEVGALLGRLGRRDDALAALREARDVCHVLDLAPLGALAACRLAAMDASEVAEARRALASSEGLLPRQDVVECRWCLWRAAGERADLTAARETLDLLLAHAPPECRERMSTRVPLHREILAASSSAEEAR
jgi:tetratricopeptide (TPR) repeat protein